MQCSQKRKWHQSVYSRQLHGCRWINGGHRYCPLLLVPYNRGCILRQTVFYDSRVLLLDACLSRVKNTSLLISHSSAGGGQLTSAPVFFCQSPSIVPLIAPFTRKIRTSATTHQYSSRPKSKKQHPFTREKENKWHCDGQPKAGLS